MESSTAAASQSTGSTTIADMLGLAAERYGDRAAVRYKRDGAWHDVSFSELGEIVSEIARGLIDLGLQPGDRVSLLCSTRPEWSYADFAITSAGGVVVPIYPTNSPSECAWVAGNSESRFIVCEDASQTAKIDEVRGELPALEAVIAIEPADGRDRAGRAARARPRARRRRGGRALRRGQARGPVHVHLHLRARPVRRRAACSRTATTAACSRCPRSSARSSQRRSSTSSCRSRTPTRS